MWVGPAPALAQPQTAPAQASVAPPPVSPGGRRLGIRSQPATRVGPTANMESPTHRNMRLRSCGSAAGRVGRRPAWRWLPGYGAAGAGTDCQVVAEPVRWGAGQVRGHAGAPLSPGSGQLEGQPGSRRRSQYLACGAPGGSARGVAGREGLDAGSRWSRIFQRKNEGRAPGAGGGKQTPQVAGASPLLRRGLKRPKEKMAEPVPLGGPAAVQGSVVESLPTPLRAAGEADGRGAGSARPPSYLRSPGAPSSSWASRRRTSAKEFILLQATSKKRLFV